VAGPARVRWHRTFLCQIRGASPVEGINPCPDRSLSKRSDVELDGMGSRGITDATVPTCREAPTFLSAWISDAVTSAPMWDRYRVSPTNGPCDRGFSDYCKLSECPPSRCQSRRPAPSYRFFCCRKIWQRGNEAVNQNGGGSGRSGSDRGAPATTAAETATGTAAAQAALGTAHPSTMEAMQTRTPTRVQETSARHAPTPRCAVRSVA
jgi:hypothetical protein